MLKVTFCAYDKPDAVGGPMSWLQRLLPALRQHGIEARCLFFLHQGTSGPAVEYLTAQGFDCPTILAPATSEERIRWIGERLRENPPDVFVPNLVVAAYLAGRWLRAAGIPTVGVLHSDDAFYQGLQNQFLFGRNSDRLTAVVCVSAELERQLLERHGESKVTRIGCGSPLSEFIVKRRPGVLRVAYVGRLAEEQKRILELAHAFCKMVRDIPGTEAVIYGDGPERDSVEQILAAEGGGLAVRLGGLIDSNRMQEAMLACDVMVLLSDYEGLPIALMEAMACGCVPVCLRMRSGIPELVEDGVTGLLVDDRQDGFVTAIRRLREDPDLWERLSQAARTRIQQEHSSEAGALKWAGLLHELHRETPAKRPIRIPRKLRLPPVHPALATADLRAPSNLAKITRFLKHPRLHAGKFKRRLLGSPCSPTYPCQKP